MQKNPVDNLLTTHTNTDAIHSTYTQTVKDELTTAGNVEIEEETVLAVIAEKLE